jgi:hypothetical protein
MNFMGLKVGIKAIKNPLNWVRLSPKPISKILGLGIRNFNSYRAAKFINLTVWG